MAQELENAAPAAPAPPVTGRRLSYDGFERAEPAALAGVIASLGGFVALLAAEFSTIHSAALAFGLAASQALLTRPAVYSPKSIEELRSQPYQVTKLPELLTSGTGLAHPHEPTTTIGVLVILGGFLLQLFTGSDFTPALLSAAGIAGFQTAATRARVSSPATARQEVALRVLAEPPDKSSQQVARQSRSTHHHI